MDATNKGEWSGLRAALDGVRLVQRGKESRRRETAGEKKEVESLCQESTITSTCILRVNKVRSCKIVFVQQREVLY